MELLARCRDVALPFYTELFESSLTVLRDHLFEQGERSGNLRDQQLYLAAIQSLNSVFPEMRTAFERTLQAGYERYLNGQHPIPPKANVVMLPQRGDLKLVGRDQLEDELAVANIVSRANTQQSEALWALNRRLSLIDDRGPVADEDNPFAPAVVGYALHVAMQPIDCELKARIVMYKLLGKRFLTAFGRVLGEVNELLRTSGLLPELRYEVRKVPTAESRAKEPASAAAADALSDDRSIVHQQRLMRAVVHELRQRMRHLSGPRSASAIGASYQGLEAGGAPGPETFDAMDYALILTALQRPVAEREAGAPAIEAIESQLFNELKERAQPDGRHRLAEDDANVIDLVGLLFRELLDDKGLPSHAKALLSHLHTPYLKLALLDASLLDSAEHPARLLLSRLAELGGGWGVDEHDRVVMPKLRGIVDRVLSDYKEDPQLFVQLLAELDQFMEGVERRAAMVARRSRDAQEGVERLQVARQCAAAAVSERLRGCHLPPNIERLLREPWTDFLAFNYLRGGEEGLAWRSALKVIEGVLWSVQSSARDAADFTRHREQLERSLAEGLRTIGYDSAASERMLASLREAQELAAAGKPVVVAASEAAPTAESEEPARADLDEETQRIADDLIARAEFGMLFEFRRSEGLPIQLRLAWFSRVTQNYMFVNQAGVKQRMLSLAELAHAVGAGDIRIVEQRATFVERALGAILRRLQKTQRPQQAVS